MTHSSITSKAMWLWTNYLTSRQLRFFICNMGTIRIQYSTQRVVVRIKWDKNTLRAQQNAWPIEKWAIDVIYSCQYFIKLAITVEHRSAWLQTWTLSAVPTISQVSSSWCSTNLSFNFCVLVSGPRNLCPLNQLLWFLPLPVSLWWVVNAEKANLDQTESWRLVEQGMKQKPGPWSISGGHRHGQDHMPDP